MFRPSCSLIKTHNFGCDFCKKTDFLEYRFKCLICDNYDLCGTCFEKRKTNNDHDICHPMVRFDTPNIFHGSNFDKSELRLHNLIEIFKNETHTGVECNVCNAYPIKGLKFKCDSCFDYNICFECYKRNDFSDNHAVNEHPLIVVDTTSVAEIDPKNIEFLSEIAKGSFGIVYKANLLTLNKVVAVKVITLGNADDEQILYKSYTNEIEAYKRLQGVNILKMYGFSTIEVNNVLNLMILTEFMRKGSLTHLLKNEPEITFRKRLDIACDIASGMSRIHEQGFIHFDIRPDNILISSDYKAKIGDMGIAELYVNQSQTMGHDAYMPPEFYTKLYDQKLDVFTFGLTINELFNGVHNMKHPIVIDKKASICNTFINSCIDYNPEKRLVSKQIKESLRMVQKVIEKVIFNNLPFYFTISTDSKNQIFQDIYIIIVTKMKEISDQLIMPSCYQSEISENIYHAALEQLKAKYPIL